MSYAILNLEVEHEIGRIDEESYKSSFAMLQDSLKRTTQEKTELEQAKNKLANTLLGDNIVAPSQKTKTTVELMVEPKQELPEPPVVVYVKEIGKAGI
jgi:transketolase